MKTSGTCGNNVPVIAFLLASFVLLQTMKTHAAPNPAGFSYPGYLSPVYLDRQNPRYLLQTISRLRQALINEDDLENYRPPSKRSSFLEFSKKTSSDKESKRFADFGTDRARPGVSENRFRLFNAIGR